VLLGGEEGGEASSEVGWCLVGFDCVHEEIDEVCVVALEFWGPDDVGLEGFEGANVSLGVLYGVLEVGNELVGVELGVVEFGYG
jgi:hypothetical protein